MIIADAIVHCLRELNLRYLFGVSGANIEHIHDSVHRLGNRSTGKPPLQSVIAKSEFGAAFMADARARIHHTLGVCCATSGGGMMNLAVGIAESFAQEVPVLALIGQPPLLQEGKGAFQDSSGIGSTVNAKALCQAIAKYTCKIESVDAFWELFFQSLTRPMQARKGPAVMLLPRDVMTWDVGDIPPGFMDRVLESFQAPAPVEKLQPPLIQKMKNTLAAAKAPVIILGSGAVRQKAVRQATDFARANQIPLVTTLACPNACPHQEAGYLGMIGVAGHPSAHDYIENHCDLIISLGSQLRMMTRATLEAALTQKELWLINDSLDEVDPSLNPGYRLQVPVTDWLKAMEQENTAIANQPTDPEFSAKRSYPVTCIKPEPADYSIPKRINTRAPSPAGKRLLTQSKALKVLNAYLPEQGHVLFDAGNCAASAAHFLKMPPGVSNTIALGMGGMGYAVAAAIGAQLGEEKHKRSMVLCGDGAFMITGLEIHTAVDLGLPILWVVFNNGMHGMCVTRQQLFFAGRIEGTTYGNIDIARVACGLGTPDKLWTQSVRFLEDLAPALEEYQNQRKPVPGVLELKIHQEEMPPFKPFLSGSVATEPAWEW